MRVREHLGISLATGKKFTYNPNNVNNTAILNHVNSNCIGNKDNFKIIGNAKNDFILCLKESLLIYKDKPKLNISERSMPLKLFN